MPHFFFSFLSKMDSDKMAFAVGAVGLSLSAESIQKRPSIRRSNSRDKRHYLHRSASRRNKENGSRSNRYAPISCSNRNLTCACSFKGRGAERKNSHSRPGSFKIKYEGLSRSCSFKNKTELCSCPAPGSADEKAEEAKAKPVEKICVTLTYKPRV